ncbi:MAG TPA: PAS domain-containing protein [Ktedonobacterales bacterium]|nr:PAS domain-containing protein [Ktedonobacterales bacterium]
MSASPAHEPRQAPMPRRAKARSPRADRFPRLPLCVLSAEPAILFRHRLMGYVLALLISGVSALLILLLVWRFPAFHLEGVLLMAGIVAVALTWGAGPGLFATCVSTGLLAFVVLPPHFSWQLQDPTEWVDVVVLLVGGVGASLLASQSARVRRRAEALAAQMSEAQSSSDLERLRLRALVDALPVPVALLDTQEQMLEFNPALQTFLGVPRPPRTLADCQQAKAWWPATGQPVTPRAWPIARAALTGEYVTNEEIELETADGQRKVVLDSATPIRDMRGDMHGAVGVFQDMTEHKRLEGALRQAQQDAEARARELEAIFEALTDGLLVYDAQGLILHSNTAARGLFGFEAQPEFASLPWQERASRYGSRDAEGKRVPSEDLEIISKRISERTDDTRSADRPV